ncbi:hypothetical protein C8R46DRAFT_1040445 [Mycena filopes]|nr:hypothetical protein C8R46DRAFT_1040445 [Mycena filopes]
MSKVQICSPRVDALDGFFGTRGIKLDAVRISTTMFASPTSIVPSSSSSRRGSLRERCGFTLYLSFAPLLPDIRTKGHLGPTAANLPRRKRSSVVSIDLSAFAAAPIDPIVTRTEYFG